MTIKEASVLVGISSDTLRYYEREKLIGPVEKTKSGIRDYNETDIKRLTFIKCMRNAGVPINVLKTYMDLYDQGDKTIEERKNLLDEQRIILEEKIKNMEEAHNRLVEKLKMHNEKTIDEYLKEKN